MRGGEGGRGRGRGGGRGERGRERGKGAGGVFLDLNFLDKLNHPLSLFNRQKVCWRKTVTSLRRCTSYPSGKPSKLSSSRFHLNFIDQGLIIFVKLGQFFPDIQFFLFTQFLCSDHFFSVLELGFQDLGVVHQDRDIWPYPIREGRRSHNFLQKLNCVVEFSDSILKEGTGENQKVLHIPKVQTKLNTDSIDNVLYKPSCVQETSCVKKSHRGQNRT
mmetsp:Transcript_29828/g.46162  ORF Transcript_29828/g.46162 Transcript_29828/m.46162 type:complete len:217 (+) Transcript_29828:993-1643(+)